MTEKRFIYDSKSVSLIKDGEFWLDGNVDTACNHKEICEELNELVEENERLKSDNKEYIKGLEKAKATSQSWASDVRELREQNCQLERENEQLKKENQGIQDKVMRLLDYVELKQCVTRTEIKKWWNGDVE